jgi:OOP family OmpA-OmpF porin
MKKHIVISVIAAAALAPMVAQSQNYVGVNAGKAEQEASCCGHSIKDGDTAFKLYGGHQFTKYVGIESGYNHLGTTTVINGSSKAQSIYVTATGTLPLNEQFALFAKAGLAHTRSTIGTGLNEYKYKKTGPMIGIGASYSITPTVKAVVEYEAFGKTIDESIFSVKSNALTAGVRFTL